MPKSKPLNREKRSGRFDVKEEHGAKGRKTNSGSLPESTGSFRRKGKHVGEMVGEMTICCNGLETCYGVSANPEKVNA